MNRKIDMDAPLKIKVLIVDDHDLVQKSLTLLLETFEDIEVVGSISDGRMALALCVAYQPDVVLMDMHMPHMGGAAATRLIYNEYPSIQIIVLSSSVDETLMYDVLQAGAISYLLKTGTIGELVSAIREAYRGKSTLAPEATSVLISVSPRQAKPGYDLTNREREILAYMTKGLNNGAIAQQLMISTSTVKYHVSHIFTKLGVRRRTKVVALAVEHNLYAQSAPDSSPTVVQPVPYYASNLPLT
jgi:NarL family two-component system response regulator LiaR